MSSPNPQTAPSLPAGPARNNNKVIRGALWAAAVLFGLFMGLLFLTSIVADVSEVGLVAYLVGIVAAVLPVPIYLTLALWLDRYEKEPIWMLALAFAWGAVVANAIALFLNTMNGLIVGMVFGQGASEFYTSVISAPVVEEGAKGLALFILFFWKKDEFDNVIDGIIYAAMVGLGFAMVENFGYYGGAFADMGIMGALLSFGLRGVASPFMHPIFTAMTGIGLGLARQSNKTSVNFIAPVVGVLVAMMLHSLWNFTAVYIDPIILGPFQNATLVIFLAILFLVVLLKAVPPLLAVLAAVFFGLRREGRIVRHYLTPELQSGLITQQEYNTLGSVSGRLGASFRALSRGGFGGWRAYSRLSQAATELAFHRERVSRGITSVDAEQREAAYVQLLRGLKGRPQTG